MQLPRIAQLNDGSWLLFAYSFYQILFPVLTQRTSLDVAFRDIYRPLRLLGLNIAGRSGDDQNNIELVRRLGKTQNLNTRVRSLVQFCDTLNGPGRRNDTRPISVHRLRPGDIDIIGAMGDSLTAGNGIFATNLLQVTVENKGMVWSIGGQGTWRQFLTLPNILKEFNPDLYGYSLKDGLSTDRSSKFNVAELGAMSRDVPYEAKVLVKRLQRDPKVNMTTHWKLITLLIGNNDFCTDICFRQRPEDAIKLHKKNMLKAYRYLRDNVPRLMLNVVPAPNLRFLTRLSGMPPRCHTTLTFECPCLMGKSNAYLDYIEDIIKKWIAEDFKIAARDEFNTETFTINIQPFTLFRDFFRNSNGKTEFEFLSDDCFHLSQKGQAIAANSYWNNMLEDPSHKSVMENPVLFHKFLCPTQERPYLITRRTSLDVAFRDIYRPLRLLGLNIAGRSGDDQNNIELVRRLGRTSLDVAFRDIYRPLRLLGLNIAGRSGDDQNNIELVRRLGKTQNLNTRVRSLVQFCDTLNGPGRRNDTRPISVHRLRPGDIDIIGAMGDSLTAGNGIFATNLLQVTVENKGMVWSIGGQGTWRQFLTLPNILKEFNPDLYGYSLKDGLSTDRSSKFNVAELGAMSRDVPYEAKVLVKRLQRDPKVNMTTHWKLITLLIGNNDFCTDICFRQRPEDAIKLHKKNMLKAYRYLRDNVPRLMLNVVPAPNLRFLTRLSGMPPRCHTTLTFECPCLMGKSNAYLDYIEDIIKKWIAEDFKIAARDEFNTETFTINIQPFTLFRDFFRNSNGKTEFEFLSDDCFHLSQKGQAIAANSYWNNMLEDPSHKSVMENPVLFHKFLCPTQERPYLITRVNSRNDFII